MLLKLTCLSSTEPVLWHRIKTCNEWPRITISWTRHNNLWPCINFFSNVTVLALFKKSKGGGFRVFLTLLLPFAQINWFPRAKTQEQQEDSIFISLYLYLYYIYILYNTSILNHMLTIKPNIVFYMKTFKNNAVK